MRSGVTMALAILLACILAFPASAWGPDAHTLIAERALQMVPQGMRPFYISNARYVVALTMLPDDWRETHKDEIGPNHYIDLDLLEEPPFSGVPADRAAAERKYGKEKLLEAGILPWAIEEHYSRLVKAFTNLDSQKIVLESALLSHYIGDAHVPFHATQFYDGKTPQQKGIHFRWESALVALELEEASVSAARPAEITDIARSALGWCMESHSKVDIILAAEDRARERDPNHAYMYYKLLAEDTLPILQQRISRAVENLAGVYAAAWNEAGRPTLPDKPAPLLWGQ